MKKQLFILTFISITFLLKGQNTQPIVPYMPTSPQAEAIQRYGEYAINYSTGIPDISIPLYEINHRGYKLPLTLKYSPQPLKTGYNYQIFGHGWGLSVNSCISRTIEGRPDEWNSFKFDLPDGNTYYADNLYISNYSSLFTNKNYVHDKFHATLPNGSSFDFIIEKNNNNSMVYTISDGRQVNIQCSYSEANINSFVVTDEQGVKYSFEVGDTPIDNTYGSSNVSWQLTRIDLPYSTEPILFTYGQQIQTDTYFADYSYEPIIAIEEDYHKLAVKDELTLDPSTVSFFNCVKSAQKNANDYKMKLLTSITYGNSTINLTYTDDKGYTYVRNILIADGSSPNRSISLCISRQGVHDIASTRILPLVQLDSVLICGNDTKAVQKYTCLYNGISCCFNGTDHWGYLNYVPTNTQGVATFNMYIGGVIGLDAGISQMAISNGVSIMQKTSSDPVPFSKVKLCNTTSSNIPFRQPSEPSGHALLRELIYPTGGYTDFEFENHHFITATNSNGDFMLDPSKRISAWAGGFRIKTITNYAKNGVVSGKKNFRYGKSESGCGVATVDPNILTYMNCSTSNSLIPLINIVLGVDNAGNQLSTDPLMAYATSDMGYYWNCSFTASNFRRLLNGRPPVVYPVVTVYDGNYNETQNTCTGGKTVYKYNINTVGMDYTNNRSDSCFFESPTYYGNALSYTPQSFLYNNLDERRDYKNDNGNYTLIKKEKNQWTSNVKSSIDFIYKNQLSFGYFSNVSMASLFQARVINFGISMPLSTTITTYGTQGDSITSFTRYTYNYRNQLINRYDTCSNTGQHVKTVYTYPDVSANGNTPAVITSMINSNIISPVLKDSVVVSNGTQDHVTSGKRVDYGSFTAGSSTLLMPTKAYSLEMKSTGSQYTFQGRVVSYSANGNPLEYVTKDSVHTCYIWGYNDRYMVASVVNASYNTSGDIISGSNTFTKSKIDAISGFSGSDADLISKLTEIRTTLPDALVTTYTHKPLTGVTSVTDPRGVATNYTYDAFDRLYLAQNDDKNILASYKYNFAKSLLVAIAVNSACLIGTAVTATGTASGSSNNLSWQWVLKSSDGSALQTSSSGSSFTFTRSNPGKYTVLCTVTDNISGQTATTSQTVTYCTTPSATITLGASSYHLSNLGTALVTPTGGSGNYSYSWTLSNSSGTVLASSTSGSNFNYDCSQAGQLTVKCVVTDNVTGQTTYATATVTCIALSATLSINSGNFNHGVSYTASLSVSGGSGNYSYTWYLIYGGYPIQGSSNSTFTFTCPNAGTYYVVCSLVDSVNGNVAATQTIVCQ